MSDNPNWLTGAAESPFLPIIAGLVRGVVGIASGFGFAWATTVTGDQITMGATAAVAVGMLGWSAYQKISAIIASRRAVVSAAIASAEQTAKATQQAGRSVFVPVTVTETPEGQPNVAVLISPVEMEAAAGAPLNVAPSPARPAA